MSLHIETTSCEWHDHPRAEDATESGRACEWRASCECEWVGPWRSGETLIANGRARGDYRNHVESALGAAAYYSAPVACRNCGSEHDQGILVGTHVTSEPCERCGTRMLNPCNEAWDSSRPRAEG